MKKKRIVETLVCMLAVLGLLQNANAQTGSIMLYGSLNYTNSKNVGSEFSATPFGIGYQFDNHVIAGGNFAFDIVKNGSHQTTASKYEAGPFYSYGWKIGDYFVLIGQVDAHYQWGKSDLDEQLAEPVAYHGYLFRAYPLAAVTLGKGWALKVKWGEISINRVRGMDPDRTVARDFIAGFGARTVGVGVSKNISF